MSDMLNISSNLSRLLGAVEILLDQHHGNLNPNNKFGVSPPQLSYQQWSCPQLSSGEQAEQWIQLSRAAKNLKQAPFDSTARQSLFESAITLYRAGRWQLVHQDRRGKRLPLLLTPEQQDLVWRNLRDAAGIPAGTATSLGMGTDTPTTP